MFALIETNGATHIAIHVPHQGADKTLPALAAMLEQNAKFICKGYREMSIRKPSMGIVLSDRIALEDSDEGVILIAESGAVIGEDFAVASPDVFVSNAKTVARLRGDNDRQANELRFVKQELEVLKQRLADLSEAQSA